MTTQNFYVWESQSHPAIDGRAYKASTAEEAAIMFAADENMEDSDQDFATEVCVVQCDQESNLITSLKLPLKEKVFAVEDFLLKLLRSDIQRFKVRAEVHIVYYAVVK